MIVLRPSIARRLLATVSLTYGLVFLVFAAVFTVGAYSTGSGDYDREMDGVAHVIETLLADATLPPQAALRVLALKIADDGRRVGAADVYLGFQVHDAAGALVARDGAAAPQLPAQGRAGFFEVQAGDESWRVVRRYSIDGRWRIDVTQSKAIRHLILRVTILNAVTLWQLVIGFPVLLLPVWFAVRAGLAPLSRLSKALEGRPSGDLEPVGIVVPHRELMPLVEALNTTLARLSELLRHERAFLADAAHELRTPLALIAAQYDTLRRAPDAAAHEAAVQRLGLGVARSVRLVNQLLALARLDADVEAKPAHVDLADLARECLALHAAAAAERGIELSYQGRDSLPVWCPGHVVESVINNLVSNAIRYGHTGGQVAVTLDVQGDQQCVLSVSDDGPGIAPEARSTVFERFRRGPMAGGHTPGSGLGLAIVLAASRQLGARIEMRDGLNGTGLCVSLSWHVAAAPAG